MATSSFPAGMLEAGGERFFFRSALLMAAVIAFGFSLQLADLQCGDERIAGRCRRPAGFPAATFGTVADGAFLIWHA